MALLDFFLLNRQDWKIYTAVLSQIQYIRIFKARLYPKWHAP